MPAELVKLADEEVQAHLKRLPHWEIDNGMLQRRFTLPSFPSTMFFACAVAHVAEVGQHHPDLNISSTTLRYVLSHIRQEGLRSKTSRWLRKSMSFGTHLIKLN